MVRGEKSDDLSDVFLWLSREKEMKGREEGLALLYLRVKTVAPTPEIVLKIAYLSSTALLMAHEKYLTDHKSFPDALGSDIYGP